MVRGGNNNSKAIAIIQARMSSERLPGKVLKPLAGKPVLWHIYQRLNDCENIGKIIIATSTNSSDNPIESFCIENNFSIYRGSLNNVLSRFINILKNNSEYSYYVRVNGDSPLLSPMFVTNQINALFFYEGDITWSFNSSSIFEGVSVHSYDSLFTVDSKSNDIMDQEHVGNLFFSDHPELFKIVELIIPDEFVFNNIRLTLDEPEDYKLIKIIYDELWRGDPIKIEDVINFLMENKHLLDINKNIMHKNFNIYFKSAYDTWKNVKKVGKYKYQGNM